MDGRFHPFQLPERSISRGVEDLIDTLLAISEAKVRDGEGWHLSKEEATKSLRQFQEQVKQLFETCSIPPSKANGH